MSEIDAQHIIKVIVRAEECALTLRDAARSKRKMIGERVNGTTYESSAPIDLNLFDQAEMIHYCLQGWARIVEEEYGSTLPRDDTEELGLYLRRHATWIAVQAWTEDMVLELRDHAHMAEGMLGTLPRRTLVPTPCGCGAQQWVYPDDGWIVRCRAGHESKVAEHAQDADSKRLTIAQTSKLLGVSRRTIGRMIERGELQAEGAPPTISCSVIKMLPIGLAGEKGAH
ncbi:helix-turn-helix domain-containing protein [Devriesea agamarum]|uniref:helix-turn-helix domain-containing protein n=1 Tax=Devriesea agamarum TaxID=472569 RepID=UPI00071D7BBB|nr:helix-turn-helix domain-containing protein [Devriesea agamarum]